jgi:uncharacterized protein YbbK (DUF523 family)
MILVSACLVGVNCRYDGKASMDSELLDLFVRGEAIPVCPEVMGGLPTPRIPAERVGELVIDKEGNDVTKEFRLGAEKTLEMALTHKIEKAILKSKSPSCGMKVIYDGTHTRLLTEGNGMTTDLLLENDIIVETRG